MNRHERQGRFFGIMLAILVVISVAAMACISKNRPAIVEPIVSPATVINVPSPKPLELKPTQEKKIRKEFKGLFKASHYCLKGTTASGKPVKEGVTVAVDPKVIPLGTKLYIEGYGTRIAQDTGGAIKGNKLDIYIPSYEECIRLGVPTVKVWIIHEEEHDG